MKRLLFLPLLFLLLVTGCSSGFNSSEWKSHNDPSEIDNPRYHMTDDLQKNILKKGVTTEDEIFQLLGQPTRLEQDGKDESSVFSYLIGWNSGADAKPVYFMVKITAEGKYEEAWTKEAE